MVMLAQGNLLSFIAWLNYFLTTLEKWLCWKEPLSYKLSQLYFRELLKKMYCLGEKKMKTSTKKP